MSGKSLECIRIVSGFWKVSGRCLKVSEGVWKVSEGSQDGVWKVSRRCTEVVWKVSGRNTRKYFGPKVKSGRVKLG